MNNTYKFDIHAAAIDAIFKRRWQFSRFSIPTIVLTDSYKMSHHNMVPKGTELLYFNCTHRSDKRSPQGIKWSIAIGQQVVVQWLVEEFRLNFFGRPKDEAMGEIRKELSEHYGLDYDVSHFEALYDLGYLPIKFKAIPEGSIIPFGIPVLTGHNTHPDFAWLPLCLETPMSSMYWKIPTSATIAYLYKKILMKGAMETDPENIDFVDFQGHDFSARGMSGEQAQWLSGLGHCALFKGSDTVATIWAARHYYDEKGFVHGSVPASEHSVSSACIGVMGELEMIRYYMGQYPAGILSVVSDTLDLTKVVKPEEDGYIYQLKDEILRRNGKVVIRPDSSPPRRTPVDIICGHDKPLTDREMEAYYPEFYHKGVVECLADMFGTNTTSTGYERLHDNVGTLYGEAINFERTAEMIERLKAKGFSSTNMVLGIGSFTYGYNTRDTLQIAFKATYVEVNGQPINIYKDPMTDGGGKKSHKGLLRVDLVDGVYTVKNECTWEEEAGGVLQVICENEEMKNRTTLTEIRERLNTQLKAELEAEMIAA